MQTLNRPTVICCGLFIFVIVIKQAAREPEQFLALTSRHILLPRTESPPLLPEIPLVSGLRFTGSITPYCRRYKKNIRPEKCSYDGEIILTRFSPKIARASAELSPISYNARACSSKIVWSHPRGK